MVSEYILTFLEPKRKNNKTKVDREFRCSPCLEQGAQIYHFTFF